MLAGISDCRLCRIPLACAFKTTDVSLPQAHASGIQSNKFNKMAERTEEYIRCPMMVSVDDVYYCG